MALPVAVVRRSWRVVVVEAATIVVALATFAATWLPLAESPYLAPTCDCDPRFQLAELGFWVPPLLVAIVGVMLFGGAAALARTRLPRWVSTGCSMLALVEALLAIAWIRGSAVSGPRPYVVIGCHLALVALLVIRARLRGDSEAIQPAAPAPAST